MNIYYFNITYTCNSKCVFCYSHNTIHTGLKHNEIELTEFIGYLRERNVQPTDRVIINGGEPFLHSEIIEILKSLHEFDCDVLIYTNGRCLKEFDFSFMTNKYRFVIPVHGHRAIHDEITRCKGSFNEMSEGIRHLKAFNCKVDIKVILNPKMLANDEAFMKSIHDIKLLEFNNAIHITKMADTIISKRNSIPSVSQEIAAKYTSLLFQHFKDMGIVVKIYDTCVKLMVIKRYEKKDIPLRVFFKDAQSAWEFPINTPDMKCKKDCTNNLYCRSAVCDYSVLEYNGGVQKGIE